MSGSSSSYSPIIKEVENIDCNKITFVTSLTAPVASVVSVLKVNDMLDVQLISPSSLQVFNNNGELAGALISSSRDRIG